MGRGGGKEGERERGGDKKSLHNSAHKKGRGYLNALARKVVFLSHSNKKLHC